MNFAAADLNDVDNLFLLGIVPPTAHFSQIINVVIDSLKELESGKPF
jgi:hypothetical protein